MIEIANYFSADEYLQWEEQQEEKHEYVDGLIYTIAGASESHVDIKANLTVIFANHRRGGDYKFFSAGMRLNDETIEFQSINIEVPIAAIYEGVDLG